MGKQTTTGITVHFFGKDAWARKDDEKSTGGWDEVKLAPGPMAGRVTEVTYGGLRVECAELPGVVVFVDQKDTVEGKRMSPRKGPVGALTWLILRAKDQDKAQRIAARAERAAGRVQERNDDTSTCPCCFGRYIAKNAGRRADGRVPAGAERMVLHGFERPGHGYTIGRCIGVGFEPYEVSVLGTQCMLAWLLEQQTGRTAYLAKLKAGAITSLTIKVFGRANQVETIKPGDHRWAYELGCAIHNVESHLRSLASDIKDTEKAIATWAPAARKAA